MLELRGVVLWVTELSFCLTAVKVLDGMPLR
jgi:hypothetical protein